MVESDVKITRALISTSDKQGLVEFARGLAKMGVALLSTGGTATALREAGLSVRDVSEHTGSPEILDGRVKTLHPKVHGGILARRELAAHRDQMREHRIEPIDMVVVNLYPFESVVAAGASFEEGIENIDIGGPTMIRAAAKNWKDVAVVVDPGDYVGLLREMEASEASVKAVTRFGLAKKAFERIADYDIAIARWLREREEKEALS